MISRLSYLYDGNPYNCRDKLNIETGCEVLTSRTAAAAVEALVATASVLVDDEVEGEL